MIEGAKAKVEAKAKAKVKAKAKAKVATVAKAKAKAKVDVSNGKSSSSLYKKPASANDSDKGSFHTMCVCVWHQMACVHQLISFDRTSYKIQLGRPWGGYHHKAGQKAVCCSSTACRGECVV